MLRWALTFLVCTTLAPAQVWTWQGDNTRSGVYIDSQLTPNNVNPNQFGLWRRYKVDGQVYAEPLYVAGVPLADGQPHALAFIATAHDSVYAFDLGGAGTAPVWVDHLGAPVDAGAALQCGDIYPEVGIIGTPVIDLATNTLYVVAKTTEPNHSYAQRLHALDLATGAEKFGGPTLIATPGFDPLWENQRAGLLLNHGVIQIVWAGHCDMGVYHGWLLSYDAATLGLRSVFNATPGGTDGGIWQSGAAPAADAAGSVYLSTGNGLFDASSGGVNFGDSVLRFPPGAATPADYFTPSDQLRMSQEDWDLSSSGVILTPAGAVATDKQGDLFLLNPAHLGDFSATSNIGALQWIANATPGMWSTAAFYNQHLYLLGSGDTGGPGGALESFALANGQFSTTPQRSSAPLVGHPGATPAISTAPPGGAAVVWYIDASAYSGYQKSGGPAVLHVVDAQSLAPLYDSSLQGAADAAGGAVKFTVPAIADGRVLVGADHELDVYGLRLAVVRNPDFSLSLPASISIPAGQSKATAAIVLSASDGFTGSVALDCSAPDFVICTVPASAPVPATVAITIDASDAAPGSFVITATGADALNPSDRHIATATIAVGGLALTTTAAGGNREGSDSAQFTVSLAGASSGTDPAGLACSPMPAPLTCGFTPTAIPPGQSSVLTVAGISQLPPLSGPVSFNVLARAPDGQSPSAVLALTGWNFSLALSPAALTTVRGQDQATFTVTSPATYATDPIVLQCAAIGYNCAVSPATLVAGASSQLVVSGLAAAPAGAINVAVTGVRDGTSHGVAAAIAVTDFQIAPPNAWVATADATSATTPVAISAIGAMPAPVDLACTVPSPLRCAASPAQLSLNAGGAATAVTITAPAPFAGTATIPVSLTGTAAGDQHTVPLVLEVQDFSLSAAPLALDRGNDTASEPITITPGAGGFNAPIQLSCQVAAPAHCDITPTTLTLTGLATFAVGEYPVLITATSGLDRHLLPVSVSIADFSISVPSTSVTVVRGTDQVQFSLTSAGGVQSSLSYTCSAPSPATCAVQSGAAGAVEVSVTGLRHWPATTPLTIAVTAAAGADSHTIVVTVAIQDFTLASSASSLTPHRGTDAAAVALSTTPIHGLAVPITLSCQAPAPLTCTVAPATVTPGAAASLTVAALGQLPPSAPAQTITVTAAAGDDTQSLALTVALQDFLLSAPAAPPLRAGQTATVALSLSPFNGYRAPITLSCSGAPPLATCTLSPSTIVLGPTAATTVTLLLATAQQPIAAWLLLLLPAFAIPKRRRLARMALLAFAAVSLSCGGAPSPMTPLPPPSTPAGSYPLTVTATDGTLQHTVVVPVSIAN